MWLLTDEELLDLQMLPITIDRTSLQACEEIAKAQAKKIVEKIRGNSASWVKGLTWARTEGGIETIPTRVIQLKEEHWQSLLKEVEK